MVVSWVAADCDYPADVFAAVSAAAVAAAGVPRAPVTDVVTIGFYLIIRNSLHPWNNCVYAPASRHMHAGCANASQR